MTENPTNENKPIAKNIRRKSNFLIYLDKNPTLKEKHEEALKAKGKSLEDCTDADIATIEDAIDYMHFEMTRAKSEDTLRGRTLIEYNKSLSELIKTREFLDASREERELKQKRFLQDKKEADEFIKVVCQALTDEIIKPEIRQKLSEKIQKLYDEQYGNEPGEQSTTKQTQ